VDTDIEAYEKGFDAYESMLQPGDNPYPAGGPQYDAWNEGWSDARIDASDVQAHDDP